MQFARAAGSQEADAAAAVAAAAAAAAHATITPRRTVDASLRSRGDEAGPFVHLPFEG